MFRYFATLGASGMRLLQRSTSPRLDDPDGYISFRSLDRFGRVVNQKCTPGSTPGSTPGNLEVQGTADPAATVKVNVILSGVASELAVERAPAPGSGTPAIPAGSYFRKELAVSNSGGPAYPWVEVVGFKAGQPPKAMAKGGHLFLSAATVSPTYDLDGNLLSDHRWSYTWDAGNRLITMETLPAAVSAGVPRLKLEFTYDSQSRRVSKKKSTWNTQSSSYELTGETRFLYDGWLLLAELTPGNGLVRGYTWGLDLSGSLQGAGGIGGLLWITDATSNTNAFSVADGNGNVIALVDATSTTAATVADYEYDPFGRPLRATGPWAASGGGASGGGGNPFRFSTKYTDAESGLLYFGYRYYDPTPGRWLNRDPIGERIDLNIYACTSNNLIVNVDLLGRSTINVYGEYPQAYTHTNESPAVTENITINKNNISLSASSSKGSFLWNLIRGGMIHEVIFKSYSSRSPAWTNKTIQTIVHEGSSYIKVVNKSVAKLRPDIVDRRSYPHGVYEIKSEDTGAAIAHSEALIYSAILCSYDVISMPGNAGGYPTEGAAYIPLVGHVRWYSPEDGAIIYTVTPPPGLVPVRIPYPRISPSPIPTPSPNPVTPNTPPALEPTSPRVPPLIPPTIINWNETIKPIEPIPIEIPQNITEREWGIYEWIDNNKGPIIVIGIGVGVVVCVVAPEIVPAVIPALVP